MTIIIKIALLLLGMSLAVQLTAALFGIIDLWYALKREFWKIFLRILVWSSVIAAIAWATDDIYRPFFLWGLPAFVLLHISFFLTGKVFANKKIIKESVKKRV
ncbi:MAG: hypothetical protein GY757_23715 [bacterium]|nr:hypothetical protein [bacterium]